MKSPKYVAVLAVLAAIAAASGVFTPAVSNKAGRARVEDEASAFQESMSARCEKMMGVDAGTKISVVMVADPGVFSGTPENRHYMFNLEEPREPAIPFSACADVSLGRLLGQDAAVITSGIGPVAAGLCVQELLQCASVVKDIIYVGTSGWSPQRGGVLSVVPYSDDRSVKQQRTLQTIQGIGSDPVFDPAKGTKEGCSSANPSPDVNRIGDLCISSLGSVNWVCKMTEYTKQCDYKNDLCYLPAQVSGPGASQLYGKCEFEKSFSGDALLAEELHEAYEAAASRGQYPARKEIVEGYESEYWGSMKNGTGVSYDYSPSSTPKMNPGSVCMEIDAQFFYSGAPWEMAARQYVADALNKMDGMDGSLDMTKVTAVSAMEAIGMDDAIIKYNSKQPNDKKIPTVNFRGMSNLLHSPVKQEQDGRWASVEIVEEPIDAGYEFAIASTATTVLELFKQRCLKDQADASLECSYTIHY